MAKVPNAVRQFIRRHPDLELTTDLENLGAPNPCWRAEFTYVTDGGLVGRDQAFGITEDAAVAALASLYTVAEWEIKVVV
jgi:hypothetical protein